MQHNIYDNIKQYLNEQLPETDRLAFEQQMKTDPEFAEEVATWAAIYQGIQEHGDEVLNTELTHLGKNLLKQQSDSTTMRAKVNQEQLKSRAMVPRWVYAAAALLLLLVIALPLYQKLNDPANTYASAETLYSENFQMPNAPAVRDATLSSWRQAYENKQFPEAIAELEKLLSNPAYPRKAEAQLFIGLSHLGAGDAQNAIETFQNVSPDSFEWEDAQWYTAMAYLKLNDTEKAKSILQALSVQASAELRAKAVKVLTQIK